MNASPHPHDACISLSTAAVLTGRSVRTWQRRIEDGQVPRLGDARALVPVAAVLPALAAPLDERATTLLVPADQGSAAAQAELGALLALQAMAAHQAGAHGDAGASAGRAGALHFLELAAQQGEADAMHWLALLHAAGLGSAPPRPRDAAPPARKDEGDDALALMWLARAAAHGHAIARAQLAALLPGAAAAGARS